MRRLSASACALLLTVPPAFVAAQSLWDTPPFGGIFVVVDARPIDGTGGGAVDFLGEEVIFANQLEWLGERRCETWNAEQNVDLGWAREDPAMIDLFPPSARAAPDDDPIVSVEGNMWLSCDGSPLAALIRVDNRVLVLVDQDRGTFWLLERPVHDEDARPIQRALNEAGYDAGPVDGDLGPRTRTAIAAYLADRLELGAPPGQGVVTERLMSELIRPPAE
ncbi:MAG: peptidoglycan-binding domain-containing protein [Azospirillaceae bacterium]